MSVSTMTLAIAVPEAIRKEIALAAWKDDVGQLEELSGQNLPLDHALNDGSTPLHLAAAAGAYRATIWLLQHGSDPNRITESGTTPLLLAARGNHLNTVAALLRFGANPNLTGLSDKSSALFVAACYGFVAVADTLIDHPLTDLDASTASGVTPLMIAAQNGHVEICKLLCVQPSVDVNKCLNRLREENRNMTKVPRSNRVIKALARISAWIRNGATGDTAVAPCTIQKLTLSTQQHSAQAVTPLLLAAQNGHAGVVRLLLDRGANVSSTAPPTARHAPAPVAPHADGSIMGDLIRRLGRRARTNELSRGAGGSQQGLLRTSSIESCSSPIHYAVAFGNLCVVRELLLSYFDAKSSLQEFRAFIDNLIAFESRTSQRPFRNEREGPVRLTLVTVRSFKCQLHFACYYLDPKSILNSLRNEASSILVQTAYNIDCLKVVRLGLAHSMLWQRDGSWIGSAAMIDPNAWDKQRSNTCLELISAAQQCWSPKSNWLWPKSTRKMVVPLILNLQLVQLPKDVTLEILSFCSREWWSTPPM